KLNTCSLIHPPASPPRKGDRGGGDAVLCKWCVTFKTSVAKREGYMQEKTTKPKAAGVELKSGLIGRGFRSREEAMSTTENLHDPRQCAACKDGKPFEDFWPTDEIPKERDHICRKCFPHWLDEQWALDQVQPRQS